MRKKPLPLFPERDRRWPGKKDTKRWCKGVVGREHKAVWKKKEYRLVNKVIWMWNEKICQVCNKRLEYDFEKVQKIERSETT